MSVPESEARIVYHHSPCYPLDLIDTQYPQLPTACGIFLAVQLPQTPKVSFTQQHTFGCEAAGLCTRAD